MEPRRLRAALSGRGFLLFPAAAFAVHELRYDLGYGAQAGQALSAQGHGYLDSLAPWVGALLALGLGAFLARIARASASASVPGSRRPFARLWLLASISLAATYAAQEALEGVFAAGHPGGLAGIFGHGGWWAIVLSALGGLVVAGLLSIASGLVRLAARRPGPVAAARLAALPSRPGSPALRRRTPLASAFAGRAPPAQPGAAAA